jgi:benzoyl-CoA reductase subunit C
MFEQFVEWERNRHEYARAWKERTGGKVLGYFCTYLPEEIPYAAGVLPVRILGSHEPQDVTESHIFGMFCPFCRDCLAQGLKGRYDYLDGIAIAQSCLHIRQAFTSWQKHVPVEYSYYLPFPHGVQSERAYAYLAEEIRAFRSSIESWTGRPIATDALERSVAVYNENRSLLRQVYEARKGSPPKLTGEEAMEMVLADQVVDKADHNRALRTLLEALPARSLERGEDIRLMLVGSEDDDLPFGRMVESLGAVVVNDEHCTGTRYFWNPVKGNGDVHSRLAARYVDRPPCPSKDWPVRTRIPHVLALAREWGVAGVILIQQKFCDPHELDIPALKKALEEAGIRTLFLEFDVTVPLGQFRIRVEAFLEMLRQEEIFGDDDLF